MFFYTGFILTIIGLIIVGIKTIKTRNIISPQIIVLLGIFVYLYLPAITLQSAYVTDNDYNLVILLGTIGAFISCEIFPYNIVDDGKKNELYKPIAGVFRIGAYLYAVYLVFQIISAIFSAGGIIAAFRVNRLSAYLTGGMISDSLVINFVKEGLKIFFYYYFVMLYENGKKIRAIALFSIPMIHHRFTAVTRFDFIAMAASLVIFIIYKRMNKNSIVKEIDELRGVEIIKPKKVKILRIVILGVIGIYLALIFMRVANFTRYGSTDINISLSFSSLVKSTLSNDSLYYEYFHRLYNALIRNEVNYEYGKSWFLYPIINFIPRAFWAGKPYTAFSARMTDKIFWSLTSGNPVVTFSMIGEGFAQFGHIGSLICPIIFLGSRWINFNSIKRIKYNQMYMLITIMSLVTYMRSEAPIFYAIIDGLWLWVIRMTCTNRRTSKPQ